ncbi:sperm-tail PG-rich repeat-containing protein 2 isoform X1 [Rattus norvegicus]|nr:sperm-tail PG-rich repeat-containing protein 2 isoform X1 [Rattus norvegicus]|eukprot:XP_008759742.2 PREDICTED: sperm-tail PG-rich repeat-containing protein 2 isoform X1 [Rattus norvegicus]
MYDRAPRWLDLANRGSTEEHVGPGTYQVPFPKQQATGCYAPFLSLSSKKDAYVVSSDPGKAVPGPAHYNVSQAQYKIKGGRTLQNREKRFKKLISDGPGPASYDCPYLGTLCIRIRQKICRKPAVSRSLDIPSIPSSGKSHGYHLNEDDTIMRRTPPSSDKTMGPAYYNPQFDYPKASLKYKGVNFGIATGRQELLKYSGPGPGHYDIIQKRKLRYENINIKRDQEHYCYSYVPRLYEEIALQEEKKGVPGPGKYNIKSQFDHIKSMSTIVDASSLLFFPETERFEPIKSSTPAPGTYNETRTAFKVPKKRSGLFSPFGQRAARFTEDYKAHELPGPGFYDISTNIVKAQVKKPHLKKKMKTGFGSSVPRALFAVQEKAFAGPGPSDYQVVRGIHDELPNLMNKYAAFLSREERTTPVQEMSLPAPGCYDVQKSYDMSQVQHNYMPPRSSVAKQRHSSFLSAAPRCLGKISDGPGPATYNPILMKSGAIISFVKAPRRFEEFQDKFSPGPTTYELSPFFRHSLLKRTYNVTLPCSASLNREHAGHAVQKTRQKYQRERFKHPNCGKTEELPQCN